MFNCGTGLCGECYDCLDFKNQDLRKTIIELIEHAGCGELCQTCNKARKLVGLSIPKVDCAAKHFGEKCLVCDGEDANT